MTITSIAFTKLFADSNQVKEEKAIKNRTIKSALVQLMIKGLDESHHPTFSLFKFASN